MCREKVKVYIAKINRAYIEAHMDQLICSLPTWRREKAERLAIHPAKISSVAAGVFLQQVLGDEYGIDLSNPKNLKLGAQGKPEFGEGPCFNMSHSGEYVVMAVGEHPLGVDVEHKEDKNLRIATRMFLEEECAWIAAHAMEEQQKAFRIIWTMKEAYLKMTGEGITKSLKSFYSDASEMVAKEYRFEEPERESKEYEIVGYYWTHSVEEYQITVCTGKAADCEYYYWDIENGRIDKNLSK